MQFPSKAAGFEGIWGGGVGGRTVSLVIRLDLLIGTMAAGSALLPCRYWFRGGKAGGVNTAAGRVDKRKAAAFLRALNLSSLSRLPAPQVRGFSRPPYGRNREMSILLQFLANFPISSFDASCFPPFQLTCGGKKVSSFMIAPYQENTP